MKKQKLEKLNQFEKFIVQNSQKQTNYLQNFAKIQQLEKQFQNNPKISSKKHNLSPFFTNSLHLKRTLVMIFMYTLLSVTFSQDQINLYKYCQDQLQTNNTFFDQKSCVYPKPVYINQTFLQKIKDNNEIHLRLNFYFNWNLSLFKSVNFIQNLNKMFSIDWTGVIPGTLQCSYNQNALYEHGLFTLKFQYNQSWSDNISIIFSPEKSMLLTFQYSNDLKTPDSFTMLPDISDNNLQMYSANYNFYFLVQYIFFIMIVAVWLLWIIGLFYGKIIIVDLIIGIQIIFSLFLTMGILPTYYSAMISEKLFLLNYLGIYDLIAATGQQDRSIYQQSQKQFKSLNGSVYFSKGVLLMLFYFLILGILRLCTQIAKKVYSSYFSQQNNINLKKILQTIQSYILGQFGFYGFFVFLWPGNISSCIYIQFLLSGGRINFLDIISFILFNLLVITYFLLLIKQPKMFGEFTKQLLNFGAQRYYYNLIILFSLISSYLICFTLSSKLNLYLPLLLIAYSIFMICIMIFRNPFKNKANKTRSIILYSFVLFVSALIQIQNILQNNQISNIFAILIAILLLILCVVSCYYLFFAIKLQGIPKFKEWIFNCLITEKQKQEKIKQMQNTIFNQLANHFKQQYIKKISMDIDYIRQYEMLEITQSEKKQKQNELLSQLTTLQNSLQNKNQLKYEKQNQKTKKMLNKFKKQLKQQRMNNCKKNIKYSELCLFNQDILQKQKGQQLIRKNNKKIDKTKEQTKVQITNNLKQSLIEPVQQEYPEQLITHYQVHKLFPKKKTEKPVTEENNTQTKVIFQQQQQQALQKLGFNIEQIDPIFVQYFLKSEFMEQSSEKEDQYQKVTYAQWAYQIQKSQRFRDQKLQMEIQQQEIKQLNQRERQRRIRWNEYFRTWGKNQITNKKQTKKQFKKLVEKSK